MTRHNRRICIRRVSWLAALALLLAVASCACLRWDDRHAGRQVGPVPAEPVRPVTNIYLTVEGKSRG